MNSNTLQQVYAEAGVRVDKLGCVMLDAMLPAAQDEIDLPWYVSPDPDRFWIKGRQKRKAHVTLLYGILKHLYVESIEGLTPRAKEVGGNAYVTAIREVMDGWEKPDYLVLEKVSFFPSPYPDEPYSCIIGHVQVVPELQDAHGRLSFLPHVDTFPGYKPHVTLGYVKLEGLAEALVAFKEIYSGSIIDTGDLDLGKMP